MKMTKIVPIVMTALFVGSTAPTAYATMDEPVEQEEFVQPAFVQAVGTIDSMEVREDLTYYTVTEGENISVLVVSADTLIFDRTGKKSNLKIGDKVTAYTDASKPMILIYPPQYSPEVIIVETEAEGMVAVGTFDENLIDTNLSLQLTISEETELSSLSSKKVTTTDLAGQHLLVFYTVSTKSIPAQTTPHKVVLLDQKESLNPIIEEIIAHDFYEVDGAKMVPLRLLAEKLGYTVVATENGAFLTKGAQTYTITRDEKVYSHNDAVRYFEVAPTLLEQGKTYVPLQFIEELI